MELEGKCRSIPIVHLLVLAVGVRHAVMSPLMYWCRTQLESLELSLSGLLVFVVGFQFLEMEICSQFWRLTVDQMYFVTNKIFEGHNLACTWCIQGLNLSGAKYFSGTFELRPGLNFVCGTTEVALALCFPSNVDQWLRAVAAEDYFFSRLFSADGHAKVEQELSSRSQVSMVVDNESRFCQPDSGVFLENRHRDCCFKMLMAYLWFLALGLDSQVK